MGEEVRGGEGCEGVAEGIDEEASVGDEIGGRERGGNWGKRKRGSGGV